ncbi:MAG: amino acid ABC transporter permease, partial [Trichococcus flocculiformis]|nr:amino acid ABC transporter permease [Trichococcus flocculiformis]
MDLDFIRKAIPMYQEAAFLVLRLGWIGIIFAFIIGL